MKLPVSSKQPEQQQPKQLESPLQATGGIIVGSQCVVVKWLPVAALVFLTFNAAYSAFRSRHSPSALAFLAFVYADLVLLLVCLRRFEALQADSSPAGRGRLKAAIWALAAALNLAFSWRVAEVMPPALGVAVWLMSGTVVAGGFYGLFIYRDADAAADTAYGDGYAVAFVVSPVTRKGQVWAQDNV